MPDLLFNTLWAVLIAIAAWILGYLHAKNKFAK